MGDTNFVVDTAFIIGPDGVRRKPTPEERAHQEAILRHAFGQFRERDDKVTEPTPTGGASDA